MKTIKVTQAQYSNILKNNKLTDHLYITSAGLMLKIDKTSKNILTKIIGPKDIKDKVIIRKDGKS